MSQTTAILVGPQDHGRRMSLAEFEHAEGQEGHLYELGRGIVIVTDVPKPRHGMQVAEYHRQLTSYDLSNPGRIHMIAGGSDCKILLDDAESERHPDLAVYTTPPPSQGDEAWSLWVPAIVIQVVSSGSEHRDYVEKREEYLAFGVHEYWISDASQAHVTCLRRSRGRWKEHVVRPPQTYGSTVLPGFELNVTSVLRAGGAAV